MNALLDLSSRLGQQSMVWLGKVKKEVTVKCLSDSLPDYLMLVLVHFAKKINNDASARQS